MREVVVGTGKMLGVVGTFNEEKNDRNEKKHTVRIQEVVVGDGKMLGVVGTINKGKQR